MTWDKAKLQNISFELNRNEDALIMLSPRNDSATAVVNRVYVIMQVVGMGLDAILTSRGYSEFFTSLFSNQELCATIVGTVGHPENFTTAANALLSWAVDLFATEAFRQFINPKYNVDKILDKLVSSSTRVLVEHIGNGLGTLASWNLFDSFYFTVEAEYNSLLPTVSTPSCEVLSSTQAVVVAELESMGTLSVTEVGVCYRTMILPSVNDYCVSYSSIQMPGSYQCQLNNLQPNTTYYARAYAKCPLDIVVYGNQVSFNTGNLPTVTTHEMLSANIGDTWATVTGSVVFPDSNQPTEYGRGFVLGETEYGLTVNSENVVLPYSGTELVNYSCTYTSLWPETPYYVRAYSYSPNGEVVYGNVVSFTTQPVVSQIFTITATANPANDGTVTGGGTYNQGQSCTVTATANNGFTFTNWTENGNVVSTNSNYTFTVNSDRTLVANFVAIGGGDTHAYVDLGLPSGMLWATCNVGASSPEDCGDYFAWGETLPKDYYNWSTYQYCNGSNNTLTKYCNKSNSGYNGFTDNLTTLLPEDDAATANWGNSWRMPTLVEWEELYQNTTHTWTTQNGVIGRLFTASNGNSLFLPAVSYRYEGSLNVSTSGGFYWSSSLNTIGPNAAWYLGFYSDGCTQSEAKVRTPFE